MEIVIKVGVARKIGMPDYGSYQASCHMDVPANIAMIGNPEELERLIAQLYKTCVDSVNTELSHVKPVVKSPVPQPEPEKPKSSVFGQWLKDKAIAYGLDMATITGLLYREVIPIGKSVPWTEQGKELAGLWNSTNDAEKVFEDHLTRAFHGLESAD